MSKLHALETIANDAFRGCSALAHVMFAPNLRTIGEYAICDCTSLEEADMSKLRALDIIGYHTFSGCSALARIMLAPNLISRSPQTTSSRKLYMVMGFKLE